MFWVLFIILVIFLSLHWVWQNIINYCFFTLFARVLHAVELVIFFYPCTECLKKSYKILFLYLIWSCFAFCWSCCFFLSLHWKVSTKNSQFIRCYCDWIIWKCHDMYTSIWIFKYWEFTLNTKINTQIESMFWWTHINLQQILWNSFVTLFLSRYVGVWIWFMIHLCYFITNTKIQSTQTKYLFHSFLSYSRYGQSFEIQMWLVHCPSIGIFEYWYAFICILNKTYTSNEYMYTLRISCSLIKDSNIVCNMFLYTVNVRILN